MPQPYRIESITLRDIGVFEHTRFDFPPIKSIEADNKKAEIHIFTGPNGCGKSTLLYALATLFDHESFDNKLLKERFITGGANQVSFSFAGDEGCFSGFSEKILKNNHAASSMKMLPAIIDSYHKKTLKNLTSPLFPLLFAAFAYSGVREDHSLAKVSTISQIKESPFDKALSFTNTARPALLVQWIANNRAKVALSQLSGDYDNAEKQNLSLKRIQDFIYDVCNVKLDFTLDNNLELRVTLNGVMMDFNVLPEGLKSILSWITDLTLRIESISWTIGQGKPDIFSQSIILFLDEVDIHLHPKWQRRILPAIQTLLPNAQVFVSTHSPFVVGSVEDAWVYRLPEPQQNICRDPHIADVIKPEPSSAGKSYQLILEEVFGVPEQFDVETEQQLADFYQLRKNYLANPTDDSQLKALASLLSQKGEEVSAIISMELRQLARLTKKD